MLRSLVGSEMCIRDRTSPGRALRRRRASVAQRRQWHPGTRRSTRSRSGGAVEAATGVEPVMEVLQTSALPLGYAARRSKPIRLDRRITGRNGRRPPPRPEGGLERVKGLEPSTFCMASRRSSRLSYTRSEWGCYQRAPGGAIRRFAGDRPAACPRISPWRRRSPG